MRYKVFFIFLMISLFITGCASLDKSDTNRKEVTVDNAIFAKWNSCKSEYIEEMVLKSVKIKQTQASSLFRFLAEEALCEDSYDLLNKTYLALGEKTLHFLNDFKLNNDLASFNTYEVPIIKKRLSLISLLNGYIPKNIQEKRIINRIRFFSPCKIWSHWKDDEYNKNSFPADSTVIKKYKIGPLTNGKYIFVKMYIVNMYEYTNKKPKYITTSMEVSDSPEKCIIFVYDVDFVDNDPRLKDIFGKGIRIKRL